MATHVTVEFADLFRANIAVWRRGLSKDRGDRKRFADILLQELRQRLIRSGGKPEGVSKDESTSPPQYWCELAGNAWVVFTITDRTTLFTRFRVLRLLALERHPPPPATPGVPPA